MHICLFYFIFLWNERQDGAGTFSSVSRVPDIEFFFQIFTAQISSRALDLSSHRPSFILKIISTDPEPMTSHKAQAHFLVSTDQTYV